MTKRFSHGGNDGDDPDSADLNSDIIRRNVWVDGMKTGIELASAKTKTRADAEQGGQDWEDVNEITYPAVDPVTQDGIEARFHRHRKVFPVRHETQQKSDQAINDPPMDPYKNKINITI